MWMHVAFILTPMPFMSFLLARHAKSLFVAFDHYCDPHVKDPPDAATADVMTASPVHSH
jgi:hypothetical protein